MTWIKVNKIVSDEEQIYARVDEDGLIRLSCTEDSLEYQAYLKSLDEANTL